MICSNYRRLLCVLARAAVESFVVSLRYNVRGLCPDLVLSVVYCLEVHLIAVKDAPWTHFKGFSHNFWLD